ncbi:CMRF35-like molecule 3 [Electrophorus electricus]|uniref:CMRF35-like molecule 3 n=1 Tax=Electrophorus electricus TaxID=8005 RepID=UPI0015D0406F|nr:CMRF35-like molecule 3 [Electrophorus electricus]
MMKIIHLGICLFLSATRYKTSGVTIIGYERKTITFKCTHKWAQDNRKYFCKDPCQRAEDILVDSDKPSNGRYSLMDDGTDFSVTITRLERADSGKYWCGVDRMFIDRYNDVVLKVLDAPQTFVTSTSQSPSPTTISFVENISISVTTNATVSVQVNIASNQVYDDQNSVWKLYLTVSLCVLLMTSVVWILMFLSLHYKVCSHSFLEPFVRSWCHPGRRQFEVSEYERDQFGNQNSVSQNQTPEADTELDNENIHTGTTDYENVHVATTVYENLFTATTKFSVQNTYTL